MGKKKYIVVRKQDKCAQPAYSECSSSGVSVEYCPESECNPCDPCNMMDPLVGYTRQNRCPTNPCLPNPCNPCTPILACTTTGPTGWTGPAGIMGPTGYTGPTSISGFTGPTGPIGSNSVVSTSPLTGTGSPSNPVTLLPPTPTDGTAGWFWSPITSSWVSADMPSPYQTTVGNNSEAMFSSVSQAFSYGLYFVRIISDVTESFITFPANIAAIIYIDPSVRYTLQNSTNLNGSDLTIRGGSINSILSFVGTFNTQMFYNGRLFVEYLTFLASPNSNTYINTSVLTIISNCFIRLPTAISGGFVNLIGPNERIFLTNLIINAVNSLPGSSPNTILSNTNSIASSLVCYNISTIGGVVISIFNSGTVNSTNLISLYNINSLDHKLQILVDATAVNIANVYRLNLLALGTQSENTGHNISNVTCVNFNINAGTGNTCYASTFENITANNVIISNVETCTFYNINGAQIFNLNNNVNNCTFDGIAFTNTSTFSAANSIIENVLIVASSNASVVLGPFSNCLMSKINMSKGTYLTVSNISFTSLSQVRCNNLTLDNVNKCSFFGIIVTDTLTLTNFRSVTLANSYVDLTFNIRTGRGAQITSSNCDDVTIYDDVTLCTMSNSSVRRLDLRASLCAFSALIGGGYVISGSNNTFAACIAYVVTSNGSNNILSGIITDGNVTFNSNAINNIIAESQVGAVNGNVANINSNGIQNVNQRPLVVASVVTGTITNAKINQANTTPG